MSLLKKITKIYFKAKIEKICGQSTSLFSAITICYWELTVSLKEEEFFQVGNSLLQNA